MGGVATTTLVIAGFLVLISLIQPIAERLRLPYALASGCSRRKRRNSVNRRGRSTICQPQRRQSRAVQLRSIRSLQPGPARMRSASRSRAGHRERQSTSRCSSLVRGARAPWREPPEAGHPNPGTTDEGRPEQRSAWAQRTSTITPVAASAPVHSQSKLIHPRRRNPTPIQS